MTVKSRVKGAPVKEVAHNQNHKRGQNTFFLNESSKINIILYFCKFCWLGCSLGIVKLIRKKNKGKEKGDKSKQFGYVTFLLCSCSSTRCISVYLACHLFTLPLTHLLEILIICPELYGIFSIWKSAYIFNFRIFWRQENLWLAKVTIFPTKLSQKWTKILYIAY